jgi:hypothetical protein
MNVDSCPLCQLILQVLPESTLRSERHVLQSFSSRNILKRKWQGIDTVTLGIDSVENSNFLIQQSDDAQIVRVMQPKIDFEVLKGWLQYCQDNHSSACSGKDAPPPSMSSRNPSSLIPSFRLIDCKSRQIVRGTNQQYTAISYIWGQKPHTGGAFGTLPNQLPETIEDAIAGTRKLGLQHLWVDRYCIDQENLEEVRHQVSRMDLIYNCAYLTIVAAAGEGPNHGLPGAGKRTRSRQPQAVVGKYQLISSLPDAVRTIKLSKWSQRGWTYQEGLLSRKRLIFLDEQVYFECSGMYCCEALNFPLQNLHTQNGHHFKASFCNGCDIGMFPKQIGASSWEVVQRIEEYTRRQLTNSSDILNGISGILRAFENSKQRVLNCAGVPIIPQAPRRRRKFSDKYPEWSPLVRFCFGLCWDLKSMSPRRAEFPSWSWTGWENEVQWYFKEFEWSTLEMNKDFRASVRLQDGEVVELDTFHNSYDEISNKISNTLHIAGWATPVQIRGAISLSNQSWEYEAIMEHDQEGPIVWRFQPTGLASLTGKRCLAIHLCDTIEGELSRALYLLVVCEIDAGMYERVGVGRIEGNVYTVAEMESKLHPVKGQLWLPIPALKRSWQELRLC